MNRRQGKGQKLCSPPTGTPVPVSSFKYLERVLLEADDDWPAVVHNLIWAWKKWARMMWLLGREVEDTRTLGVFYVAVVHSVLLYGP